VTKSGTNQFHGDAFEFIRNDYIDANSFYTTNGIHDRLHQNQFGGTIGGPVWIPKVYHGKNKFFFFAAYQGFRYDDVASTSNAFVPTAANLAGNFQAEAGNPTPGSSTLGPPTVISPPNPLCANSTKTTQLLDPMTGVALPNNIYPTGSSPTLTLNATSQALMKYLPKIAPLSDGSDVCGHVQYAIPSEKFD